MGARGEGSLLSLTRRGRKAKSGGFKWGREATVELQVVEKRVEGEKPLWSPVGSLCGEPYEIPAAPRPARGRMVRTDDFGWMQTEGGRN